MSNQLPERGRQLDNVPLELRERPQWVYWRYEIRNEKATKVPYDPKTEQRARVNDASTWGDFGLAVDANPDEAVPPVGFMLSSDDDFVGLDLDGSVKDGEVHPAATELIERLGCYTEFSPSGHGLRIVIKGELAGSRRRTGDVPWKGYSSDKAMFEVYSERRFLSITGQALNGTRIEHRQEALDALVEEYLPEEAEPVDTSSGAEGQGFQGTDDELLDKAKGARNGEKFTGLFEGDIDAHEGDDRSANAADLALCRLLAFWTGPDPERIDRLFRRSGLRRDKWERKDYRNRTIAKAIKQSNGKFYSSEPNRVKVDPNRQLVIQKASDVQIRPIQWLVHHRVPKGKLTGLAGWQGVGKSAWAKRLAAQVTTGKLKELNNEPANVLWLVREEDVNDETVPALIAAGADLERIGFLRMSGPKDQPFSIPHDLELLDKAIKDWGAVLVVFDPALGAMDAELNSYKASDVRKMLEPLLELMQKYECAGLMILHYNKGTSTNALVKVAESAAFTQVVRSMLVFAVDPESEEGEQGPDRVLILAKKNLAPPDTPAWKFQFEGVEIDSKNGPIETARVNYVGESFVTAREVLDESDSGSNRTALEDAKDFLAAELSLGPRRVKDLQKAAKDAGLAWETVRKRAKKALFVESDRENVEGGEPGEGLWLWKLPVSVPAEARTRGRIQGGHQDAS